MTITTADILRMTSNPAVVEQLRTRPAKSAIPSSGNASRFVMLCAASGLPEPTPEHRFAPPRRWRLDFAWPEHRVAVEVHGAVYRQGRHTRGGGFLKDREKMNTAQLMGWKVLEYDWPGALSARCMDEVRRAISSR